MTAEQATLRDVVALLYRADWTRLSLSATFTSWTDTGLLTRMHRTHPPRFPDGTEPGLPVREYQRHVLLAPGGKYRISEDTSAGQVREVCDGTTAWSIDAGTPWAPGPLQARRRTAGRPRSSVAALLDPAEVLTRYTLDLTGSTEAAGRPAYRLLARPRLLVTRREDTAPGQVELLVDAELGILLRREGLFHGQPVRCTGLADVRLGPPEAAGPGRFQPPPDVPVAEPEPPPGNIPLTGLGGDAVRAAAGLAAKAMGFTVRHWPGPAASGMPGAPRTPDERLQPASDDVVNLLHRTGRPDQAYTAEVHTWTHGALAAELVAAARQAVLPPALDGIFGPDAVWAAVADRGQVAHQVDWLRLAAPRRYRIDRLAGGRASGPDSTGCDGERLWRVRGSRVSVQPAGPLCQELAVLADPAWLLAGYLLRSGGPAGAGGRPGLLIVADRLGQHPARPDPAPDTGQAAAEWGGGPDVPDPDLPADLTGLTWLGSLADRVEAVLDPGLGVLLRVTCFRAGQPVLCRETRGLAPGVPEPSVFEVPPGAHPGGPLDGLAAPAAAAKAAAGLGVAGAAALVGWLQKRPRDRG